MNLVTCACGRDLPETAVANGYCQYCAKRHNILADFFDYLRSPEYKEFDRKYPTEVWPHHRKHCACKCGADAMWHHQDRFFCQKCVTEDFPKLVPWNG